EGRARSPVQTAFASLETSARFAGRDGVDCADLLRSGISYVPCTWTIPTTCYLNYFVAHRGFLFFSEDCRRAFSPENRSRRLTPSAAASRSRVATVGDICPRSIRDMETKLTPERRPNSCSVSRRCFRNNRRISPTGHNLSDTLNVRLAKL